jgi:hypothetical protein
MELKNDVNDDMIYVFEEIIPEELMEKLFARYLHTDDVQFYFEDGQYAFYASYKQYYAQKLAFEISKDRKTFTVRYWQEHSKAIEPTAVATFKFNDKKNRYVEVE